MLYLLPLRYHDAWIYRSCVQLFGDVVKNFAHDGRVHLQSSTPFRDSCIRPWPEPTSYAYTHLCHGWSILRMHSCMVAVHRWFFTSSLCWLQFFSRFPRQRLRLRRRLVTVVMFLRCRADFVTVLALPLCYSTFSAAPLQFWVVIKVDKGNEKWIKKLRCWHPTMPCILPARTKWHRL